MLCASRSSRSKSATGHSVAPSSNCQALVLARRLWLRTGGNKGTWVHLEGTQTH
ncbi:unnamed protein product [Ixodes persulcatus]